jgi:hypothetical protein
MARIQKRKYEKIDEAEIALVLQCTDSHEFYEKFRETFPTRKKGIDSISKIWKRRSEFVKKQQESMPAPEAGTSASPELEQLIAAQNKVFAELSVVMKEQLRVSREILARLPRQIQKPDEPPHKHEEIPHKHEDAKPAEPKEPVVKRGEKHTEIMIGS